MVLGAFGIASLVSRPLAGVFADAWPRQQVMMLGAVSLLAGAIGVSMTTWPLLLVVMRILQATGYVAFTTAANALASDLALPEQRGAALARFGVSYNIAITWAPISISAGIALALLTVPRALWLAGGLAAISIVLSSGIRYRRAIEPQKIDFRKLFRVPPVLQMPMATAGVFGVGYGAFLQFLPLLTERRHLGHAGVAYTVYGIGIILTRLATGRMLDRGDRTHVLSPAFFLLAAGLTGFALADSRAMLYAAVVLVAVGSGILHPALIAIHVESMPPSERGRATAGFFLGFDLGVGMGAWILSPAFQWFDLRGLYLLAAASVFAGILLVQPLSMRVRQAARAVPLDKSALTRKIVRRTG